MYNSKNDGKTADLVEQVTDDFNIHFIQVLFIDAVSEIASCITSTSAFNHCIVDLVCLHGSVVVKASNGL